MVEHGITECRRITGTSVQNLLLSRFSNNSKNLTHSVVTLVGYIGTKNEEGWYFGTLSNWAFYVSNQSDVSNSGRHRRRHRRSRRRGAGDCSGTRRSKRQAARDAIAHLGARSITTLIIFFHYWPVWLSTYPRFTLVKEYLQCYQHLVSTYFVLST
jgi:hypothetical protein